jgi:hypothetical protein
MNTSLERKELARKLNTITTKTLKTVLTKSGIKIGDFTIVPINGKFELRKNNNTYYLTYSKSSAMTIAGLIMKKAKAEEIISVVNADRTAYTMHNNLVIYNYHLEQAINNSNNIKKNLMSLRFDRDYDLYQDAKKILQSSYSKIF